MKWLKELYKTYIFDPLAGGNGKIIIMVEIFFIVLTISILEATIKSLWRWKEG
jgi:hypothetical protein